LYAVTDASGGVSPEAHDMAIRRLVTAEDVGDIGAQVSSSGTEGEHVRWKVRRAGRCASSHACCTQREWV